MVMVYSAALNSKRKDFRIILANVNGMLSQKNVTIAEKFMESVGISIEIVEINTSLNPTFDNQFNLTVYSRLFLIDKLNEDFIWFDADLLLMPGWDKIFIEFGDKSKKSEIIYGVLDSKLTLDLLSKSKNQAYVRRTGQYVNTGVIKVRTKEWKKLFKESDWVYLALNREKYGLTYHDQDILNYLCAEHINLLPAGFNYIVGDQISFEERIFIKHYAGGPKPWKLDKAGKEFLLAAQGAKYFSPKNWITQSADTVLHYPLYWQVESDLLSYLQEVGFGSYKSVVELRNSVIKKLDKFSFLKNFLIQLITRKYFS
jgi:lipopolysaccharide biosynthesis glycosyltransferase